MTPDIVSAFWRHRSGFTQSPPTGPHCTSGVPPEAPNPFLPTKTLSNIKHRMLFLPLNTTFFQTKTFDMKKNSKSLFKKRIVHSLKQWISIFFLFFFIWPGCVTSDEIGKNRLVTFVVEIIIFLSVKTCTLGKVYIDYFFSDRSFFPPVFFYRWSFPRRFFSGRFFFCQYFTR